MSAIKTVGTLLIQCGARSKSAIHVTGEAGDFWAGVRWQARMTVKELACGLSDEDRKEAARLVKAGRASR